MAGLLDWLQLAQAGLIPPDQLTDAELAEQRPASQGLLSQMVSQMGPAAMAGAGNIGNLLRPGAGFADRMPFNPPPVDPHGFAPPAGMPPMAPAGDMGGYSPQQSMMMQQPPSPAVGGAAISASALPPPRNVPSRPVAPPTALPPVNAPAGPPMNITPPSPQQGGGGLLGTPGLGGGGGGGLLGGIGRMVNSPEWNRMGQLLLGVGGSEQAMAEYLNPGAKNFDKWHKMQQLDLQRRQLEEKPSIQKGTDAAGNDVFYRITPGGQMTRLRPDGSTAADDKPNNPYSLGAKATEAQSKDATYATRMFGAEKILRDLETAGTSLSDRNLARIPIAGNYMVSKEYQKFDQAQRDFINATLRRESGAVISDKEFDNANKQYLPQPGDSPETLAQKRLNRQAAIEGIAGGAGPNYRPPAMFGPNGELVERQREQQGAGKLPQGVTREQAVTQAAQALNRPGVTPEQRRAIYKRLQDWGVMQ